MPRLTTQIVAADLTKTCAHRVVTLNYESGPKKCVDDLTSTPDNDRPLSTLNKKTTTRDTTPKWPTTIYASIYVTLKNCYYVRSKMANTRPILK